jgi:peptide/nickel transport system ATP-binding protein
MSAEPLLSIENLRTHMHTDEGAVKAVDGVSFDVHRGETVCLVGESGSGKTVACESITKLIPMPPGEIVDGRITFDGHDLTDRPPNGLHDVRGGRIAHIFQNPQNALDPVYSVGAQLVEAIQLQQDVSKGVARERAVELLDRVGIPEAATRVDDYPHEFSGGMKQRVVIAMALAGEPDLLIADEPTTALDVTIQAQILDLLNDLKAERDMAILFVTHDLGVVAEIADRVIVFYVGKVMERGSVHAIFKTPAHPYTQALFQCLPGQGDQRETIGGSFPSATDPPAGCRFHPRCPHAIEACTANEQPPLEAIDGDADHVAACIFYGEAYDASDVYGEMSDGVPQSNTEQTESERTSGERHDSNGERPVSNDERPASNGER